MALNPTDIQRLAHLARLKLQPDESSQMLLQLNDFFSMVERMQKVETLGVEPLYTPLAAIKTVALRLRDDAVTATNQRDLIQSNAPCVQDGLYLVPKVIE
jgi:aspartyl-tRNA(Asn)/glutamyl-tRNA(Gln) amidotransferase subunit C